MPELILFRGRPVKHRRRLGDGLRLIFFAPEHGQPGQQLTVSEADWSLYGSVQFYPKEQMPNVRVLAARPTLSPFNTIEARIK